MFGGWACWDLFDFTESLRWGADVCPMDRRSKDLLSGRGHQVLPVPGLLPQSRTLT